MYSGHFSEVYIRQNPHQVIPDSDCAYQMAFSALVLSKELHSNSKKKITFEEWERSPFFYLIISVPSKVHGHWDQIHRAILWKRYIMILKGKKSY